MQYSAQGSGERRTTIVLQWRFKRRPSAYLGYRNLYVCRMKDGGAHLAQLGAEWPQLRQLCLERQLTGTTSRMPGWRQPRCICQNISSALILTSEVAGSRPVHIARARTCLAPSPCDRLRNMPAKPGGRAYLGIPAARYMSATRFRNSGSLNAETLRNCDTVNAGANSSKCCAAALASSVRPR